MEDGHAGRQLASKWLKTKALMEHPDIAGHIPPSSLYSPTRLEAMIAEHGAVVLKPVKGAGGIGLMKAVRTDGGYSFSHKSSMKRLSTFQELRRAVESVRRGRSYLIQKGIDLAEIGGRPIDYRVKYVKSDDGGWRIRSMVGRLAKRGLFVTNLCRGGRLLSGSEGLRRSLSPRAVSVKKSEMRHLTKTATRLLEDRFPGIAQLGYDYGIDRNGHIWILEVNTRPQ